MSDTIAGKLILAGDYPREEGDDPNNKPLARVVVVMPRAVLRDVKTLPMYADVVVITAAEYAERSWIQTSERLPEKGQFILAYGCGLGNNTEGPEMDICLWDGELWDEGGTELVPSCVKFTHWMPIPKTP